MSNRPTPAPIEPLREWQQPRAAKPEPVIPPDKPTGIASDASRTWRIVRYSDVPSWLARGWRMVAEGETPALHGIPYEQATDPPTPPPGLHLTPAGDMPTHTGYIGMQAWWRKEARDALHAVATAIAPRVNAQAQAQVGFRDNDKADILDIYNAAIVAQVVEQLCERIDQLEAALAAREDD